MFHRRKLNHRINKIHERALRIVCNDHQCTFEELLERDNSFRIHEKNLQKLAIEIFKVNNGMSAKVVSQNFHFAEIIIILDINQEENLRLIMLKLTRFVSNLGSKIWNSIPQEIICLFVFNSSQYNIYSFSVGSYFGVY